MVAANVEALAQRRLVAVAQLDDLHLPDHAGQGLTRIGKVAVDVRAHDRAFHARLLGKEVDRPLAAPAQAVQAGVHHQPRGAEGLPLQEAEAAVGILVQAEVEAQGLCV